jgi:hypothetical protein
MKTTTAEYFVGKVCTVFTTPINRNFKEENPNTYPKPMYQYFMGRVLVVEHNGILIEQVISENPNKKLRAYFRMEQIVGLAEEEELDMSNPADAAVINEIKSGNKQAIDKAQENIEQLEVIKKNPFIDIDALSNMSNKFGTNRPK